MGAEIKKIGAHLIQVIVQKESAQLDKRATQIAGEMDCHPWPYSIDTLARLPKLHPWHSRCMRVTAAASVGIGYDFAIRQDYSEAGI